MWIWITWEILLTGLGRVLRWCCIPYNLLGYQSCGSLDNLSSKTRKYPPLLYDICKQAFSLQLDHKLFFGILQYSCHKYQKKKKKLRKLANFVECHPVKILFSKKAMRKQPRKVNLFRTLEIDQRLASNHGEHLWKKNM